MIPDGLVPHKPIKINFTVNFDSDFSMEDLTYCAYIYPFYNSDVQTVLYFPNHSTILSRKFDKEFYVRFPN